MNAPRPRRSRYISIPEVLEQLPKRYPKLWAELEPLSRKRQLERVRRLVQRAQRRDGWRFTKRVGRELYIKVDALAALDPPAADVAAAVVSGLEDLHQRHRGLQRKVNWHSAKLRDHDQRLDNQEDKQRALTELGAALAKVVRLESRS